MKKCEKIHKEMAVQSCSCCGSRSYRLWLSDFRKTDYPCIPCPVRDTSEHIGLLAFKEYVEERLGTSTRSDIPQ